MTNTSDSSGARPTDEAKPNWSWLQDRIDATQAGSAAAMELDDWLDRELSELEDAFAQFVTPKSLTRDLKRAR